MLERVTPVKLECRRRGTQIVCDPQSIRFGRDVRQVGICRIHGHAFDSIKIADLLPSSAAIGRAIQTADFVWKRTPMTEDGRVPCVLLRIVRVNDDVFGPSLQVRIAPISPRLPAVGADKDPGTGCKTARSIAPPRPTGNEGSIAEYSQTHGMPLCARRIGQFLESRPCRR